MNKEDIINYVMTTPGNPNRAVLEGMLDSVVNAGGTPLIVHLDEEGITDKTWQEIHDALANGVPTYVAYSYIDNPSASEEAHITGLFPVLSAEEVIETKGRTSRFTVRSIGNMTLVGLLADGYLHID